MAKIFVIDDSIELLELFSQLLIRNGHTVKVNYSGKDSIEQIEDFKPEVLLLDVRLKYEDGRELCRKIKQVASIRHIPVILLSASPELLRNFEECGAAAVIEKPFDIATVNEKINTAIEKGF